jgi:predicted O-methyltransferase YrrM
LSHSYLPDVDVRDGVVLGRVPRQGYQRGWGLQFGDLATHVEAEPLFQRASVAGRTSLVSLVKRMNIYLLMTRFLPLLPHRHIIEFGSFKGGNALFMATVMQEIDPSARIFALDTYTGMPDTDKAIDAHGAGDFADASLDDFRKSIKVLGLRNLTPVPGLFEDSFPELSHDIRFGLAHIDADIYASVKYAQDQVWHRMTPGGYVVYDDAEVSSCLGATQAVEELIVEKHVHSEQIWPHFVFRSGLT